MHHNKMALCAMLIDWLKCWQYLFQCKRIEITKKYILFKMSGQLDKKLRWGDSAVDCIGQRGHGLESDPRVWSLHVLFVSAWLLARYSGFLPQSNGMQVRLTGNSKLAEGEKAIVDGSYSLWPFNELVTCPGCYPIFTPRRLGWAPAALWPAEAKRGRVWVQERQR